MTLNSEDLVKADTEKKLCLTTKDAYRLMGIGRSAFWKIAKELPSVSLTGGRRYWCRKGIERWIRSREMTLNSEDLVKADTEEEDFKKLCLTTKDAYRLMGIGRSAFWKIAKELPSVSLTGGRRYWCRKGIERWIEANTRQGHNA